MSVFGPYPGVVRDWHDGDTCHVDLDVGFGMELRAYDLDGRPQVSCRIFGIDAPELATDAGKQAKAYAESLCPAGSHVTVVSHGFDKFGGRFDGQITLPDGSDFAASMVAASHAVVWDGKRPKPAPAA